MIVVAVVDDHEVVAHGIATLLAGRAGVQVGGVHRTVTELLAAGPPAAAVTVLDADLKDGSHLEDNLARLRTWGSEVVILTADTTTTAMRAVAFDHGAAGFLEKGTGPGELLDAVERAARGEVVMTSAWARALRVRPVRLPDRLATALRLYAGGMSTPEVAARMRVTPETVKTYVKTIREKYTAAGRPAPDRTALAQRAVEDGYLRDW
jgi:two-component system response regulator DevR